MEFICVVTYLNYATEELKRYRRRVQANNVMDAYDTIRGIHTEWSKIISIDFYKDRGVLTASLHFFEST